MDLGQGQRRWSRALRLLTVGVLAVFGLSACATSPTPIIVPTSPIGFEFPVDCGPIQDATLCRNAVEVAATAKLNPPPIAKVSIRRPRADDDCTKAFHECGPEAIIVVIQSGDTLQDVPLIRLSGGGWVRLDLVR